MAAPRRRPRAVAQHLRFLCNIAAAWQPLLALQVPGRSDGLLPDIARLDVRTSDAQASSMLVKIANHAEIILARFDMVDSDHDGNVTFEEMRTGYTHKDDADGQPAEQLLQRMLAACNGDPRAPGSGGERLSCTRQQMEASLAVWIISLQATISMRTVWEETRTNFVEVQDPSASQPCGAALGTGPPEVSCTWQGPLCWAGEDHLMAWFLLHVCSTGGCICAPTRATQRTAKLGVMGAVAIAGTADFSDPDEWRSEPSCGGGWEGVWKTERFTGLNEMLTVSDISIMQTLAKSIAPEREADILAEDSAEASFALWKSERHQLVKDGPEEQVCMITWQGSFSDGDWKLDFMIREVPFPYGPKGLGMTMPAGLVLAYTKARETAKRIFQDHCCTEAFAAKRLVLSGHSRGGALAEMTAMDAITSWECRGEKLTADHISVVLVAPDPAIMSMRSINEIWSCPDRTACLAGSAITLINARDPIAAGITNPISRLPLHPSRPVELPCREVQPGRCHFLEHYVENVDDVLVDQQRWGSTCGGHCGSPSRQLQCYHVHAATRRSCRWAGPEQLEQLGLPAPTPCNGTEAWHAEKEKCACPLDRCDPCE